MQCRTVLALSMMKTTHIYTYLSAKITVDITVEIQLLIQTLATGIQDAVSFPDFGCFASVGILYIIQQSVHAD